MPWRIAVVASALGVGGGALAGFALGLHYLPTLPVAIVEGAILFGVPLSVLGLLLTALWWLGGAVRRRFSS